MKLNINIADTKKLIKEIQKNSEKKKRRVTGLGCNAHQSGRGDTSLNFLNSFTPDTETD